MRPALQARHAERAVAELADLLNEDGTVAPEKVQDAIRTAEESLGLRLGLYVPKEGHQPSEPGKPDAKAQWDAVFDGRRA